MLVISFSETASSLFGGGSGFFLLLLGSFLLGSLFLDEVGEKFLVLGLGVFGELVSLELDLFHDLLSADSLVSDESLDLGGFVEGLVTFLDLTTDNIFANIIALSETEDLSDGGGSLWSKSSWFLAISDSWNVSITLLDNSQ